MKKIFTLLFAAGIFTFAQAQSGYRDNRQSDQKGSNKGYNNGRDNSYNNNSYNNDGRYDNKNFSFDRDKDMQVNRINQEYDRKIEGVEHNFFMGWREKQRQISFLQEQRQREINMLYSRDNDRRDRFDEYGDHDNHDNH